MKNQVELKPCPFCGGKAIKGFADDMHFFKCDICRSRGQKARTMDDAAILWNDRVAPPDHHKNSQWNKHGAYFYCAKCECRQKKKTKFCAYCGAKMKDCKTYADYFDENFPKDKFPKADRNSICRRSLFGGYSEDTLCEKSEFDCRECWEEVMEAQP